MKSMELWTRGDCGGVNNKTHPFRWLLSLYQRLEFSRFSNSFLIGFTLSSDEGMVG
jgi:hypothetical protein